MVDIGTPHIAGYSLDGKIAGLIMIYNSVCEYFSIEPKFGAEDFLPEPAVPELTINHTIENESHILWNTVNKVYRISADDAALRGIPGGPVSDRETFFDGLRKNYPIRREFQNTKVVVEDDYSSLAGKLAGIGFGLKVI